MRDLVDNKVFLGGTCGNSTWRDELIPMLEDECISFFNPVVENWDETAQKEEDRQKKNATYIYMVCQRSNLEPIHFLKYLYLFYKTKL